MKVVFRVDASSSIGLGHLMRCLTLAEELIKNGNEVLFIMRNATSEVYEIIKSKGVNCKSYYSQELKIDWETDSIHTINFLEENNFLTDWIIIDHYDLDDNWEQRLRPFTKKIMVIDDLANRKHDCDVLLDQNYYLNMEERYSGLVPEHCKLLLGPSYAILRTEFISAKEKKRKRERVNTILVSFGGSDPKYQTLRILKILHSLNLSEIKIEVVVGNANEQREEICAFCKEKPNMFVHLQPRNLASLILNADFGIGSGGVSLWERCFLGLPSIVIVVAENQIETVEAVASKKGIINLGWYEQLEDEQIKHSIEMFISHSGNLQMVEKNALQIIGDNSHFNIVNVLSGKRVYI